ncbi:MAG: translocation/assembly module TamB domain-containing protein [Spirochaetaceae bacterium]|nr:translocation/assembly module TamB domain-containing protein [Spirochaetaceae bacterium]
MQAREKRRLPRAAIVTIEITVFVGLFAAVVFGLGYARDRLDRMVGHLREQVAVQVADRLGARVRYGTVAPSALRALQVSDLELLGASGDVLLSARRLRVHYSLRTLLSTRSAVDAVSRVELTGVVADLHLPRDQVVVSAALGGLGAAADGGRPSVLPWPLTIANARVKVTMGSDRASGSAHMDLSELSLRLEPDGDGVRIVDGRARLGALLDDVAGHATQLDTRIGVDGRLAPGPAASRAAVRLGDMQSSLGAMPDREVQAGWDGKTITLTTLADERGSVLQAWIEPESGLIRIDLRAEQFRPMDLFRPAGPLEHLRPWFETTVTGTGAVIAGPDGVLSYDAHVDFVVPPASLGDLLNGPVDVALTVQGDATTATFAPLLLRSADGAARYDGTVDTRTGMAVGRLAVTDLDLGDRPVDASAEVEADLQALRLTLREGLARIGDVEVTELTGPVLLSGGASYGGTRTAPSLQLDLTGSPPDSPDGAAKVTGSITLAPQPVFAGRVDFENVDAGVLYGLLRPPDPDDSERSVPAEGLIVSAQMQGSAGPGLLSFDVPAASVIQRDGPFRAHFSAVATERSLQIADLDLVVDQSIRAAGTAELDAERLSFSGSIEVDGEPLPGTIRVDAGDGLTVHGPWGLVLQLWPGETLRPADLLARIAAAEAGRPAPFRLSATGYPVAVLGEGATADAELAGTVLNPWALLEGFGPAGPGHDEGWDAAASGLVFTDSRLAVQRLPIGALPNRLDLDFSYRDQVLTASRIRFTNDEFDLTGNGVLNVTTEGGLRAAGNVMLETGQERYDTIVALTPEELDLEVDVDDLRLDRFAAVPISGTASGRIRIIGSLAEPVITADLTSHDIPLDEDYVTLALHSTYDGRQIVIDDLAADFRDHRIRGVAGSIDTSTGTVGLGGRYEGEYLGEPLSLDLAVTGTASFPVGSAPERSLPVEAVLTIAATAVTVGGLSKPSWDAAVRWEGDGLAFSGGPLDGLSGRIATDGTFAVEASAPLPLQGSASGTLSGSDLSADLSIAALDLTLLNTLIHTTAVTVLAGSAAGTVRLHGPINDPAMLGTLQATGVVLESTLIPQRVGPLAFPVAAAERELTVGRTRPERGVAPVVVNGTVRFGQWAPVAYDFSVQTANGDGVPVDYRFGPISVTGVARGGVQITGDRESTHIAGSVEADPARVFIDNAGRGSPPGWEPLTVELAATTGRGVELTWPSEELPILEALVDVDQTVAVSYDGFSGDYTVVGDVAIRRGELFFFGRTFVLRDGLVSFAEDEGRFDPMVTVRAETRERSPDDGTLSIYLDADSPLSALSPQTVRLSSQPARPLPELRAMLGGPFADGTADEDVDLLAVAGGMATQFGVVRPMERALRDSLGLDLFSIRSQLVENLLRTPLGVSSPDLLDNTEIVVGKYLGDDLFFEALVRVESDTVSPVPELRTDLELSLEWATPFFLLEWSVLPSLTNPFQTGSALSLSWSFNY